MMSQDSTVKELWTKFWTGYVEPLSLAAEFEKTTGRKPNEQELKALFKGKRFLNVTKEELKQIVKKLWKQEESETTTQ